MAKAVSRVTDATAIIVPYDVGSRIARVSVEGLERRIAREIDEVEMRMLRVDAD
jgi:hypothetical protein